MEGTRVVVGSSDGTGQYWFPGGGALDVGKGKDLRLAELLVGGENVPQMATNVSAMTWEE